jgi:hypothetical protein
MSQLIYDLSEERTEDLLHDLRSRLSAGIHSGLTVRITKELQRRGVMPPLACDVPMDTQDSQARAAMSSVMADLNTMTRIMPSVSHARLLAVRLILELAYDYPVLLRGESVRILINREGADRQIAVQLAGTVFHMSWRDVVAELTKRKFYPADPAALRDGYKPATFTGTHDQPPTCPTGWDKIEGDKQELAGPLAPDSD